jgi:hypothetical protein
VYNNPLNTAGRRPMPPDYMRRMIDMAKSMVGRNQAPGQRNGSSPGYGPVGGRSSNWGGFRGSNPTNLVSNNMRLMNTNNKINTPTWLNQFQNQVGRTGQPPTGLEIF